MPLFNSPAIVWAHLKTLIGLCLVLGLAWVLLESLIYRSGFYHRVLAAPHSNAGTPVMRLARAEKDVSLTQPNVLVIGDSRVDEGFSKPLAEATTPELNFINLSIPGSNPRTWFYLLRAIERQQTPFDAVIVALTYQPQGTHWTNWPLDPFFMSSLVGVADAQSFPASFNSEAMQTRAKEAIWLPALLMKNDTQAALVAPITRLKALRAKKWWLDNSNHYQGNNGHMPHLQFDAQGRVIDWQETTPIQRPLIEEHLATIARPSEPELDAFITHWLGELHQLVRKNNAKLMIYPVPRGPYPELLPTQDGLPTFLSALAQAEDVTVLPADFLADIETPAYFFDALHANRDGRRITSERLAHAARSLGFPALAKQQAGDDQP